MSQVDSTPTAQPVPPREGDPEITPEVVADHGLSPEEYERVTLLRRALSRLRPAEAMQLLVGKLQQTPSNAEFLASLVE